MIPSNLFRPMLNSRVNLIEWRLCPLKKKTERSSRISGFYDFTEEERLKALAQFAELDPQQMGILSEYGNLDRRLANLFIENTVGVFSLPLGVAPNFRVNNKDYVIPMAVEESSVLAAASHGAKLTLSRGGFLAKTCKNPSMTGQIQLFPDNSCDYEALLTRHKEEILDYGNRGQERLVSRGGGLKDITWYRIPELSCVVVLVHIATCDAMGANIVNTICEKLSGFLSKILGECETGLRILTNLTLGRTVEAHCVIAPEALSSEGNGDLVVDQIISAWEFAWFDVLRASTHNKGVMNGIDPVVIATGNDWRAVEAGAHAFASQSGTYRPLTRWTKNLKGELCGKIEMPLALGVVGGVTKLHPVAQLALKILGNPRASELSEIVASVGLAQNLSALKALATEGIQKGHMGLHQKNIRERQSLRVASH